MCRVLFTHRCSTLVPPTVPSKPPPPSLHLHPPHHTFTLRYLTHTSRQQYSKISENSLLIIHSSASYSMLSLGITFFFRFFYIFLLLKLQKSIMSACISLATVKLRLCTAGTTLDSFFITSLLHSLTFFWLHFLFASSHVTGCSSGKCFPYSTP